MDSTSTDASGDSGDHLNVDEAAAVLGVTTRTLARWREIDAGPPYIRIGNGIRYPRSEMTEWLAQQVVIPSKTVLAQLRNEQPLPEPVPVASHLWQDILTQPEHQKENSL
jgi:excisionase family DNA binding protein